MTLIVSWIGVDSRTPSSMYIASDSRISWGQHHFDQGKKVFASRNHPDIFGYCGDVLFPLMVLNQIVDSIDAGLLYSPDWDYRQKTAKVRQRLMDSFLKYPNDVTTIMNDSLEIIHGIRDDGDSSFHCMQLKWTRAENKWRFKELPIEKYSYQIRVTGSGAKTFRDIYKVYENRPHFKTSRAVFQTFCDTLAVIKETTVGGAPQLVGLYRKKGSPGKMFGIINNNCRYFAGLQVDNYKKSNLDGVEWRNDLFERCDGKYKHIIEGAQRQPHI